MVIIITRPRVANRHSWDADWSQIGDLETLIGRKSALLRRWLVRGLCANHVHVACRQSIVLLQRSFKYEVLRSEMCLAWLYQLFSVPLILLTNAYAGCGRPTLNVVERFWFWLGSARSASNINSNELISELHSYAQLYSNVLRSWELEAWQPEVRTWQKLENLIAISPRVTKSSNIVCTHYVKVFCILCLCIILSDTSKASENLTFILKQSLEFLCQFISKLWRIFWGRKCKLCSRACFEWQS